MRTQSGHQTASCGAPVSVRLDNTVMVKRSGAALHSGSPSHLGRLSVPDLHPRKHMQRHREEDKHVWMCTDADRMGEHTQIMFGVWSSRRLQWKVSCIATCQTWERIVTSSSGRVAGVIWRSTSCQKLYYTSQLGSGGDMEVENGHLHYWRTELFGHHTQGAACAKWRCWLAYFMCLPFCISMYQVERLWRQATSVRLDISQFTDLLCHLKK